MQTLQDVMSTGRYKLGDQQYFRGYVSRRAIIRDLPIHIAQGSRKGQMYVEVPNWSSTVYSIRQYLIEG